VDVLDEGALKEVFGRLGGVKVVISTVGPYWKWGTPLVAECARTGTHYVDISGESYWVHQLIQKYDYLASKTGAIIIPSCGYDSLPSDFSAYLSVKALKSQFGPETETKSSVSSHIVKGGISGGTLATAISSIEDVPSDIRSESKKDYYNSPVVGLPVTGFQFTYSLPAPGMRGHVGGFWPMATVNQPLVQRTWGLRQVGVESNGSKESKEIAYGPEFTYHEYRKTGTRIGAAIWSFSFIAFAVSLGVFAPMRWLAKKMLPAGQGPSEKVMQGGFLKMTNVTSTAGRTPESWAKTKIECKGDPGYLLTSIMVTESALCLLEPSSRPPLAKEGGILTPVTGLGDAVIGKLEATGRFKFETEILRDDESRKRK